jgi:23S rRNA pseudouridine955/2504/2580 synthase
VRVPPLRVASKTIDFSDAESSKLIEKIQHLVGVLYEDDDVLAVNKPAGVASHGGTGNPVGVIEAFRQSSKHNSGAVLDLVHRLDRETSGVLLLAKSRPSLTFLQSNLQSDASQKLYLAMLCGGLPTSPLDIDSSLEVTRNQFGVKYCRPGAGKPSRTTFRLLKSFHAYSFVEAELHTGRLHQIRAHAHSIGHPVVCDDLYGTREAHAAALKLGLSRMFLHAHRLSFNHPATNRLMCVEAPLPLDLQRFLNKLK